MNIRPKWWMKLTRIIIGKTIPQRLFRAYLLLIILGSILLYLPVSLQHPGKMANPNANYDQLVNYIPYSFWNSMFVACSAITDTGLSPTIISSTYTIFGQVVIACLIEMGGLGLMTIIFLVWSMLRKLTRQTTVNSINEIVMLQAEKGNEKIGNTYKSIRLSVFFIILVQIFFALLMSFWICWMPLYMQEHNQIIDHAWRLSYDSTQGKFIPQHGNYANSLWCGIFTSISAMNNAGFDIFNGNDSIASFRNDWNIIFQLMILIEFVIGGVGFPLIFDVYEKIKSRRTKAKYKFSLFTKVSLISYFVVAIVGLIFVFSFEYGYTANIYGTEDSMRTWSRDIAYYHCDHSEFGKHETLNKVWALIFNTFSTRSAGFSTVPQTLFSTGTLWTNSILMFIGGSPSSTAGGIRVTTLAIITWTIISKITGKERTSMFHRTISSDKVRDSLIVFIVAMILVAFGTILVSYSCNPVDPHTSIFHIFYETCSAFGTVGLSMGISQIINPLGMITLIIIMFVGQLTISSTLLSWTKKNPRGNLIKYPEESITIG